MIAAPEPAQVAAPAAEVPNWIPRGRGIFGLSDSNFTGQVRPNNRYCHLLLILYKIKILTFNTYFSPSGSSGRGIPPFE